MRERKWSAQMLDIRWHVASDCYTLTREEVVLNR